MDIILFTLQQAPVFSARKLVSRERQQSWETYITNCINIIVYAQLSKLAFPLSLPTQETIGDTPLLVFRSTLETKPSVLSSLGTVRISYRVMLHFHHFMPRNQSPLTIGANPQLGMYFILRNYFAL